MRFVTIFVVASALASSSALGAAVYSRQSEFEDGTVILSSGRGELRYSKREAFRDPYGDHARKQAKKVHDDANAEYARKGLTWLMTPPAPPRARARARARRP